MYIQISPARFQELRDIAEARVANKRVWDERRHWEKNMASKGQGIFERMLYGVCCEYAAAVATSGTIDRRVFTGGDGGRGDVTVELPNGEQLDIAVKGRTRRGYDFALNSTDPAHFLADYGVLVWPINSPYRWGTNPALLEVVGYFGKEALLECGRIKTFDPKYGPRLTIAREYLTPILHRITPDEWARIRLKAPPEPLMNFRTG